MPQYKGMYTKLFNTITDAVNLLQTAQTETEEMYLSQEEPEIHVLDNPNDKE